MMAPQMAATVLCSPVFVLFLLFFLFFVLKHDQLTRDELLNIQQTHTTKSLPDFDYSDALLDIIVGGAAVLFRRYRSRRRGSAGALVKLRQRGLRTPLPSIHLANLRSLPTKTDELLLLSRTNKDFSNSAALCFTETWLKDTIPDSVLHLPNFQLLRADHEAESTGNRTAAGRASTSMRGGVQM